MDRVRLGAWYRFLYRAFADFSFHRIRRIGALPSSTLPTLYLGLHRNGALDGAAYLRVAPEAVLTLSSQLRRNAFSRLIFTGIEILRAGDRERDGSRVSNAAAFRRCAEHLAAGGDLLFFPEGTSDLGAAHLPFKPGTAKLIQAALALTPALRIVPLAAHYEAPTVWQSDVEILVGQPFEVSGRCDRRELMVRATAALEAVSLDCASLDERRRIETLAYAATLGTGLSYALALRQIGALGGAALDGQLAALQARAAAEGLRLHQGVPLIPLAFAPGYALLFGVLTPLVGLAALLNLPVLAAARWATRKFPDGLNVIALWRAIAGVGSALVWVPAATLTTGLVGGWPGALLYLGISWAGLRGLYRWRKLAVSVHNWLRATPETRRQLTEMHAGIVGRLRAAMGER